MNSISTFFVHQKQYIQKLFLALYIALFITLLIGIWSVYHNDIFAHTFVELGKTAGKVGLLLYIVTLIPGIAHRFHITSSIVTVLMLFRRQIGIVTFLVVALHVWLVSGVYMYLKSPIVLPRSAQEIAGTIAYVLLIPLFVTSNNWSVKRLEVWWGRIQRLTYIVIGLVFMHVALQQISVWSILTGGTFLLFLASFIYQYFKSGIDQTPQTVPPTIPPKA